MRKNRNFIHITDNGKSWVNAPLKDIVKLGLVDKISETSRMTKDRVFLDDETDSKLFLDALKASGVENIVFEEAKVAKESRIRKYFPFNAKAAQEAFERLMAKKVKPVAEEPASAPEEPVEAEIPAEEENAPVETETESEEQ